MTEDFQRVTLRTIDDGSTPVIPMPAESFYVQPTPTNKEFRDLWVVLHQGRPIGSDPLVEASTDGDVATVTIFSAKCDSERFEQIRPEGPLLHSQGQRPWWAATKSSDRPEGAGLLASCPFRA
ncbi:MAG TPA: hypothetical protein DD670_21025 [Planctomycetaceae bacterium]|nr:hypothetical protein [Planctomycetaceae bacterium]